MTDNKALLEQQKQRLALAIDEITTQIFSTNYIKLIYSFENFDSINSAKKQLRLTSTTESDSIHNY